MRVSGGWALLFLSTCRPNILGWGDGELPSSKTLTPTILRTSSSNIHETINVVGLIS